MAEISINLVPDPEQDRAARRAALALLTATLYDPQGPGMKELSSVALNDLVSAVVGEVGQVREESVAALQAMLTVVARQYSAFTSLSYIIAAEAFVAGQRDVAAQEPDYGAVLRAVSEAIETLPDAPE